MAGSIIVASSDAYQRAELESGAQEIAARVLSSSGRRLAMHSATSVDDIQKLRLKKNTQAELIIVTASLPASASVANPREFFGLGFVKLLQAEPSPVPCILVSDQLDHGDDVETMSRCKLLPVGVGTSYVDDCVKLADELAIWPPAEKSPEAAPKNAAIDEAYAVVEIDVPSDAKYATVRLDVTYADRTLRRPVTPLALTQRVVDKLVEESRVLSANFAEALEPGSKQYLEWQSDYRKLGIKVFNLLQRSKFNAHYGYAKGVAGSDVRLRFNLARPVFDGLWESIFDASADRYLMLDSTITRRDRDQDDLFSSRPGGDVGTLNVLAIGSVVEDHVVADGPNDPLWNGRWASERLKELPHVVEEIDVLKQLERPRSASLQGPGTHQIEVDVLSGDDFQHGGPNGEKTSLADAVEQRLKNHPDRYDVVHFAGHALFVSEPPRARRSGRRSAGDRQIADERGYLIFSGFPKPRAVPIATVARWLQRTSVELVYLSCCRSSAAQAAAEFARNNVRMSIGFRWDLDDSKAVDFARHFYQELLNNRLKVCSAIRAARDSLFNNYQYGDPIWASPVLVAQPSQWSHVEGVLRPPVRAPRPRPTSSPIGDRKQSRPEGGEAPLPGPT